MVTGTGKVEVLFAGFGSAGDAALTLTVFETVPDPNPELTLITNVKDDDCPAANVANEQFTVPPLPTGGGVQPNVGPPP